jgi:hypothetical protein
LKTGLVSSPGYISLNMNYPTECKPGTKGVEYVGLIDKRVKPIIWVAENVVATIDKDKMVSRFLAYSSPGDLQSYSEEASNDSYSCLAIKLNAVGIVYIHIPLNPNTPQRIQYAIQTNINDTLFKRANKTTEDILIIEIEDPVGFGRSFLAIQDIDKRIEKPESFNPVDVETIYSSDLVGYTDYVTLK